MLLAEFAERHLPGAMRRLARWKGVGSAAHTGIAEDLRQELALDCLEHAREIVALAPRERHARWFRLVHRLHYRLLDVGARARGAPAPALEDIEGADLAATRVWLPTGDRWWLDVLRESSVRLDNGRLNSIETARRIGLGRRDFRELWRHLAARLGFGDDYVAFWRRRLREALVQRAADLMRVAGTVALFGESRRRAPDPSASRRRVARIRAALGGLPPQADIKRALAVGGSRAPSPQALLSCAAILEPETAGVALWQFEAAIAFGEHDAAREALERAHALDAAAVPLVLAAARLAEATDGRGAAAELLERARDAHDDVRIVASLARCVGERRS